MMAKNMTQQDEEVSPKRMNFHWTTKVSNNEEDEATASSAVRTSLSSMIKLEKNENEKKQGSDKRDEPDVATTSSNNSRKKKLQLAVAAVVLSRRLRSVVTAFGKNRQQLERVVLGTLFGNKRTGHVYFAFQKDAKLEPALLIQLATPITGLVREMSTGLVRIILESDKKKKEGKRGNNSDEGDDDGVPACPLLEEPVWRTYCNGMKCGLARRVQKCGDREWKILKAVEPISMGAGVLNITNVQEEEGEEEVIYMRSKFERVVGSKDSEALYMLNPDNNAPPELSIYLLRL